MTTIKSNRELAEGHAAKLASENKMAILKKEPLKTNLTSVIQMAQLAETINDNGNAIIEVGKILSVNLTKLAEDIENRDAETAKQWQKK